MRDYQPQVNNRYWLPRSLYRRTLSLIRDYDRMIEERKAIPEESADPNQPRSPQPGNVTMSKAMRMARLAEDIDAIDRALAMIPEEYRTGVWASVLFGARYPEDAGIRTYRRYKAMFIWLVAKNKCWI